METVSFGRWKAELYEEDQLLAQVVANQPGCAIRDVIHKFCLQYDEVPSSKVELEITEWS